MTTPHFVTSTLFVSSVFYFFSSPEVDPDLWGHLFFGRQILEIGKLPRLNLYSYTAPDQFWINHEWLSEVIFYTLFESLGSPGLMLFKVAVGAGIVWVLDLSVRRREASLFVRAFTLLWAMALLSRGFNVRPQIFTYLFFSISLLFMFCYEDGRKNALYGLPFLLLLWVNLHGGFVAGLGALGFFAFWTLLLGSGEKGQIRALVTRVFPPLIFCGIVLFLNPYGLDLLKFLAGDLILDRLITEWRPITLLNLSFLEFKLAILFLLLFSLRLVNMRRWDFFLAVFTALLAIRHQRHMPLFAIAAAPFLAEGVSFIYRRAENRVRVGLLSLALFSIVLYQFHWIGKIHLQHRFQLIVSPHEYPTQAADFLQRNGIRGNLAVPFDWGEYLIWKLHPDVKVSIDGRYTTAYPLEVIRDSWEWMGGGKEWRKLLERYPSEIALTKRDHPVTSLLRRDAQWVYIYSDPIAFIFVRKVPSQAEILERLGQKRLQSPEAPPLYFPG